MQENPIFSILETFTFSNGCDNQMKHCNNELLKKQLEIWATGKTNQKLKKGRQLQSTARLIRVHETMINTNANSQTFELAAGTLKCMQDWIDNCRPTFACTGQEVSVGREVTKGQMSHWPSVASTCQGSLA